MTGPTSGTDPAGRRWSELLLVGLHALGSFYVPLPRLDHAVPDWDPRDPALRGVPADLGPSAERLGPLDRHDDWTR